LKLLADATFLLYDFYNGLFTISYIFLANEIFFLNAVVFETFHLKYFIGTALFQS